MEPHRLASDYIRPNHKLNFAACQPSRDGPQPSVRAGVASEQPPTETTATTVRVSQNLLRCQALYSPLTSINRTFFTGTVRPEYNCLLCKRLHTLPGAVTRWSA